MKLLKILTAFIALVSLQIAAAQWLHVPPPVEAKNLMIFTAGVPVTGGCTNNVTYVKRATNRATSTTEAHATFATDVGNGALLVATLSAWGDIADIAVSDDLAGSYTLLASVTNGGNGYKVYYKYVATGGSNTVDATWTGSNDVDLVVHEYSGVASSDFIDDYDAQYGDSATASASVTTTNACSQVVAFIRRGSQAWAPASGFTEVWEDTENFTYAQQVIELTSKPTATGTYTPGATGTAWLWTIVGVGLKSN